MILRCSPLSTRYLADCAPANPFATHAFIFFARSAVAAPHCAGAEASPVCATSEEACFETRHGAGMSGSKRPTYEQSPVPACNLPAGRDRPKLDAGQHPGHRSRQSLMERAPYRALLSGRNKSRGHHVRVCADYCQQNRGWRNRSRGIPLRYGTLANHRGRRSASGMVSTSFVVRHRICFGT